MKRLSIVFLGLLGLAETLCAQTAVLPQGSGTSDSPYQIDSLPNLYWLSKNSSAWTSTFVQNKDIDASPTRDWGGTVFTAIGNSSIHFTGTYHGGGHKISGLYIKVTGGMQGLFGVLSGTVDNLGLENDSVIATSNYVGGLAGYLVGGTVVSSYSKDGYVKGQNNVGGLIGNLYSGSVTSSYTTGQVVGAGNVGGLAGMQEGTTCSIQSSYSLSAVSGTSNVGGFIGSARYGSITSSYSAGSVTSTSNAGGFSGNLESTSITKSYYNSTTSGQTTSAGGSALNESDMKQQGNFVGWDFASTWILYSDHTYPLLRSFMNPLTVTVRDTSEAYKASPATVPGYTYSPEDYDASRLQGTLSLSGTGTNATNAGTYTVTPTGLWSNQDGYQIQFVSGTLAITPIALTVTADAASKVYGENDPALTYKTSGLIGSDVLTGSLARAAGENVDSYAIGKGTLANANYAIAYTPAVFAITQAALTVTAEDASKVYGESDPALAYKTSGLIGSDVLTGSLARATGENVDSYDIGQGTLTNANYAITYTPAVFAITQAALTVTADDASKVYGENDPALAYKTSGLIGSDVLTGSLARAAGDSAGSYAITLGSLSNPNYAITYKPSTFLVTPKTISIVAHADTITLGDALPVFTYQTTGLIGDDTLTGYLECKTDGIASTYPITQGTLSAGRNYLIDYTGANLIVNAPVSIVGAARSVAHPTPRIIYAQGQMHTEGIAGTIRIYTLQGKMIALFRQGSSSYPLYLSPGTYVVQGADFATKITVGRQ
jgi:hypothetical protein